MSLNYKDKIEELGVGKTAFTERRARVFIAEAMAAAVEGQLSTAKQKMAQAYDISPTCLVLIPWARLVYALGERSFALDLCVQGISREPENLEVKRLFASYLSSMGRTSEAAQWSQQPFQPN